MELTGASDDPLNDELNTRFVWPTAKDSIIIVLELAPAPSAPSFVFQPFDGQISRE